MANPAGRRSRQPVTTAQFDEFASMLAELSRKLAAVKAGMKATKQAKLDLDYTASLDKGIDLVNTFCDGALKTLRDSAPRGQRPWDEWDIGTGYGSRKGEK